MYKIMLAEDQPEVLNGILGTVNWKRHSFHTPIGCRDGRDAVAAIENGFRPDAVITDICMPFVDGLELSRYILRQLPKTLIVILSGYDKFSYAQQAIKMGVYDYVLKPVTPGKINSLLTSLASALDTRRMNDIDSSMEILLSHFLNRLITKPHSDDTVTENLKRHELTMNGVSFSAAVLDIDNPGVPAESPDEDGHADILRYALFNMASELIDMPDKALVFQAVDGSTKALFAFDKDDDKKLPEELIRLVCHTFKQHMQCTASAGIGGTVSRLGVVCESHQGAVKALACRFFKGEGSVISCADIERRATEEVDLSSEFAKFDEALRSFSKTNVAVALAAIFSKLRDSRCQLSKCVLFCRRVIVLLHEFISQFGGGTEMRAFLRLWEQVDLTSSPTIGHLENQMREFCGEILELFACVHTGAAEQIIAKAEEYILAHFGDSDLSLQSITEHLAVSVSYFSANFKAKTGSTFVEYLTRVRMEKAKQLLALSDLRAYETAQRVGYADPHYFSLAFKRYNGMSPKEFREHSLKN